MDNPPCPSATDVTKAEADEEEEATGAGMGMTRSSASDCNCFTFTAIAAKLTQFTNTECLTIITKVSANQCTLVSIFALSVWNYTMCQKIY